MSRRLRAYRHMFTKAGRKVTIERQVDGASVRIQGVRVRIRGSDPVEVSAGNLSSERRILVLAEDVPTAFRPLMQNDEILVDDLRLTFVERPDDQSHRDGDLLLAYAGLLAGA